jgi:two-component system, sensor histidine kinase and response regulator
MDGLEATMAIRAYEHKAGRHVPIIAVTAHAMKGDQEKCLAAGMDDYITKPMKAEVLYAAIERVLSRFPSPAPVPAEPPVDLAMALRAVGGNRQLLISLAKIFANDSASVLNTLRQAIHQEDAHATEQAAHSLKGAIGPFMATPAHALAADLEAMAHAGHVQNAMDAFYALQHECERINKFFGALEHDSGVF